MKTQTTYIHTVTQKFNLSKYNHVSLRYKETSKTCDYVNKSTCCLLLLAMSWKVGRLMVAKS